MEGHAEARCPGRPTKLIAMLVTADPTRVVVEYATATNWSIWGPLIGVVVGALLGALGQIVAGRLRHRGDVRREEVGVRRELYARTLSIVDELTSAVEGLEAGGPDTTVRRLAPGEPDLLVAVYRKVEGVSGELGVSGDLQVMSQLNVLLERRENVTNGWRSGDLADELEQIRDIRQALMFRMRKDVGTTTPKMHEHL